MISFCCKSVQYVFSIKSCLLELSEPIFQCGLFTCFFSASSSTALIAVSLLDRFSTYSSRPRTEEYASLIKPKVVLMMSSRIGFATSEVGFAINGVFDGSRKEENANILLVE
ncbi:hypothetical protein SLA2020_428960 [Shorea laevis]